MKIIIIFIIVFTCFANLIKGQSVLTGSVKDNENNSVFGALVMIMDENENILTSVTTDTLGIYSIKIPEKPENHWLYVIDFGFHSQKISLPEAENQPFILLETLVHYLEEVNVTANRPTIIRNMDKFVIPQVYSSPLAKGKNIIEFLKFAPLIKVSQDDVLSILNKGASVIYVNGRRSSIDLKSLSAENIEKVEIIPFPGSEYKTTDKKGIINIILRKPPDDGVLTSISISDIQKEKLELNSQGFSTFFNIQKKKVNITTGLSIINMKNLTEEVGVYNYYSDSLVMCNKISRKTTGYGLSGYANLDYNINKKHILGFRLIAGISESKASSLAETDFRFFNTEAIDSSDITNFKLKMNTPNYSLSGNFNYDVKFNDNQKLSFDLDYYRSQSDMPYYYTSTKIKTEYEIKSEYLIRSKFVSDAYNFTTRFQHIFSTDFHLKTGIEFYGANRDNDYFYGNKINMAHFSDSMITNRFIYNDITAAMYLKFDWEISDEWSLSAGLRGEYYSYKGTQKATGDIVSNKFPFLSPSVSLYYELHDDHELGFDFTAGYNYPHYYQLNPFKSYYSPYLYRENNPYLKPSLDYEFALEYTFFSDYILVLEYCYTKNSWEDFRIPVGDGVTKLTMHNFGKDHDFYVSFYLNKKLFNNFLHLSYNTSYSYEVVKDMPNEVVYFNENSFFFSTNLNINTALNKKKDLRLESNINLIPKGKSVSFERNTMCYFSGNISKSFKKGTLSFKVNDILERPIKMTMKSDTYAFDNENRYYGRTYILSYFIRFGNYRARSTQNRENNNIQNRLLEN